MKYSLKSVLRAIRYDTFGIFLLAILAGNPNLFHYARALDICSISIC